MMIPTATKRTTTTTTTTRRRTMLFFSFVVVATITDSSSFMPIGRVVDAFTVINNNYNHNYNKGIVGSPRHFYSVTTDRIIDKQQQDNNNNWNNPIQLRMTEDFDDDDHDHHDDDDIGDDHHEDEDESDDNSFDDSFDDDGDADDDDDDGIHMSVIDVEVEGDEDEDEDYDDEDNVDDEDEDEDEEDDNQRPIGGVQIPLTSEFGNDSTTSSSSSALTKTDDDGDDTTTTTTSSSQSSLTTTNTNTDTDTDITVATDKKETDWGSALGQLRNRMDDIESGKSSDPSQQLFRLMSSETPNQVISKFVSSADPNVVQAMSSAITGLLGGLLSSPSLGVEMIVKGSGEKISSLCFQLQMTGYMFRNAEYLIALKDLMDLPNGKQLTIDDYKEAFDRVDTDSSGYIDMSEIRDLFKDAYSDGDSASSVDDDDENNDNDNDDDDVPFYEITAFLEFFDKDMDGKVSWDEFSKGLVNATSAGATATATQAKAKDKFPDLLLLGSTEENEEGNVGVDDEDDDDDDDDGESIDVTETISGMIEIEMDDGTIIEVDANEYMESLKAEARKLKAALRREQGGTMKEGEEQNSNSNNNNNNNNGDMPVDIAGYLASRRGDVKSLTEGIKPEIVDTMKKLIGFVLEGSVGDVNDDNSKGAEMTDREKLEMDIELPGSALKQLALWQLVLGYRLREEEAKGDYVKLLD